MRHEEREITAVILREQVRLNRFIRRHVGDVAEAEDILQEVFFEFVQSYRLPEPLEQVGAWLLRVARNRIVDRFRKKKEVSLATLAGPEDDDGESWLEQVLPCAEAGPQAAYARKTMIEALAAALDELPAAQREVFVAHEIEGQSFKVMAQDSGVAVNTLLARKRYAVLHLRKRLQHLHDEHEE